MKKEFLKNIIIVGMTTLIITNMYCMPVSAKWIDNSKNNWNWIENGVKATGWKEIDKEWYYFNENGIMITGWFNDNGKWYNLSSSGVMDIGWKQINGKWYHFNKDGIMSIGWIDDNGTWYFTNSGGEMETGTLGIDGQVYTFSDSGAMIKGKETIQGIQPGATDVSNVKTETKEKVDKNAGSDKGDSKVRTAYVTTNSDSLNVRLEAIVSSDIIGTVAKNAEIKIIDVEKNGFYPIMVNEKKGWVSSTWISFEKPKNSNISTNSNSTSNTEIAPIITNNIDLEDDSLGKDAIRDTEPSLSDKHYYSDENLFYKIKLSPPFSSGGNLIKGNCTWYAWGRAWEITGSKPNDAGFIGNAYEWWEANKKSGKYKYGSEPRVGSIAVWKSNLPNSGGCGHVAVVEKIKDNKIYISESMWHGVVFKYREIYETNYLYGYIYLNKPNF
ncbi:hypothetical protein psyc5s11_52870 [Clostridium gelidum]|uniref:N-acetylmuramoyl-L-alanine amidase n=1 Tax=Clostridium gelidum TaxID=704125 RepID=A0ABM7TBV3_9CLOT|nr:CHAP domain-containing protein [Clostridium gelidum]BCZ49220.1 hypothetical protein psyc5s11_52870 [Clostridium gelidum]